MKTIHLPTKGCTVTLPESFCAGFGRVDITPKEIPILTFSGKIGETIHSPVYATCASVSDGENVALLFTVDVRQATPEIVNILREKAMEIAGIPQDLVFVNTTHNHSSPDIGRTKDPTVKKWLDLYDSLVPTLIEEAIFDLAPAKIFIGTAKTEALNFVRRYRLVDGSYWAIHSGPLKADYESHETEADPEMRAIRFERGDKKDIVLVNWQCHAASASGQIPDQVSADFIHEFRKGAEEAYGVHFAYFQGGCGNVVSASKIESEMRAQTIDEQGKMLVPVLGEALSDMREVKSGPVRGISLLYPGKTRKVTAEQVALAEEINKIEDRQERIVASRANGFLSLKDVGCCLRVSKLEDTYDIPLCAISFGDVAFGGAGYEMFDTHAMYVRTVSPYKMTFMCGYTNDGRSYIPSSFAYPHSGYEVFNCNFVEGTGEVCANELVYLLRKIKG